MELLHCRVQWNARNLFLAPPCCQRANSKVLGPAVYKNIAEFNESRIRPRTMGKMGQTNHEAMRKGKHWQALRQGDESLCNLLERPLQWAGERKTPWGKSGERYKHRWGKVRQASRWGPWKILPLYRIWRIPLAYSVVQHEFLAIGRLNPVLCLDAIPQVGQMSPGVLLTLHAFLNSFKPYTFFPTPFTPTPFVHA